MFRADMWSVSEWKVQSRISKIRASWCNVQSLCEVPWVSKTGITTSWKYWECLSLGRPCAAPQSISNSASGCSACQCLLGKNTEKPVEILPKLAHGRAHGGDTQQAVFRYDINGRINFSIFELKRGSWKQRVVPLLNSAKIHQKDRQNEVYSWRKFETFKKIRKLSNKQDLTWFMLILFSWRLWDIYHLIIIMQLCNQFHLQRMKYYICTMRRRLYVSNNDLIEIYNLIIWTS